MLIDLRCKHDREARELAADMFESGCGHSSVAKTLSVPNKAVRNWR